MAERRYDLVIFDLDGTLADTKDDIAAATNHAMRELGFPTHDPDRVATFVGGGLLLLLQRALPVRAAEDPAMVERAAEVFKPWYRDHMLDATRPYDGVPEMIDALRKAGVAQAIATNKPRMFTEGIVESLFPGVFEPVIACGDDAPRKPDPTCVALCRAKHPAVRDRRILFVGDSLVDIDTARAGGVDVLSCSWGYGDRAALEAHGPHWLVDSVPEITRVVLGG